jgi:hypothetical protein
MCRLCDEGGRCNESHCGAITRTAISFRPSTHAAVLLSARFRPRPLTHDPDSWQLAFRKDRSQSMRWSAIAIHRKAIALHRAQPRCTIPRRRERAAGHSPPGLETGKTCRSENQPLVIRTRPIWTRPLSPRCSGTLHGEQLRGRTVDCSRSKSFGREYTERPRVKCNLWLAGFRTPGPLPAPSASSRGLAAIRLAGCRRQVVRSSAVIRYQNACQRHGNT